MKLLLRLHFFSFSPCKSCKLVGLKYMNCLIEGKLTMAPPGSIITL